MSDDINDQREYDRQCESSDRRGVLIDQHTMSMIEDNYLDVEIFTESEAGSGELFKSILTQAHSRMMGHPIDLSVFIKQLDAMIKYAGEVVEREYEGDRE